MKMKKMFLTLVVFSLIFSIVQATDTQAIYTPGECVEGGVGVSPYWFQLLAPQVNVDYSADSSGTVYANLNWGDSSALKATTAYNFQGCNFGQGHPSCQTDYAFIGGEYVGVGCSAMSPSYCTEIGGSPFDDIEVGHPEFGDLEPIGTVCVPQNDYCSSMQSETECLNSVYCHPQYSAPVVTSFPVTPDTFDVYRNGVLIASNVQGNSYVDELPHLHMQNRYNSYRVRATHNYLCKTSDSFSRYIPFAGVGNIQISSLNDYEYDFDNHVHSRSVSLSGTNLPSGNLDVVIKVTLPSCLGHGSQVVNVPYSFSQGSNPTVSVNLDNGQTRYNCYENAYFAGNEPQMTYQVITTNTWSGAEYTDSVKTIGFFTPPVGK